MRLQPYQLSELQFAYSYRVYLRWHTHRLRAVAPLPSLSRPVLQNLGNRFGIRVLECSASDTEVLALVSLQPSEAVSACASKLKGQLSKWLRTSLGIDRPAALLGNGYFACTTGQSTRVAVDRYLDKQETHHGYAERVLRPIHVQRYALTPEEEQNLNPAHARAFLKFHIVLASQRRLGVFGAKSGRVIAEQWRRVQARLRTFALLKVSFVPDHVHLAFQLHPASSPASVVVDLLNTSQEVMSRELPEELIQAGLTRLWQPSAYIGSFGDITSREVAAYVRDWKGQSRRSHSD